MSIYQRGDRNYNDIACGLHVQLKIYRKGDLPTLMASAGVAENETYLVESLSWTLIQNEYLSNSWLKLQEVLHGFRCHGWSEYLPNRWPTFAYGFGRQGWNWNVVSWELVPDFHLGWVSTGTPSAKRWLKLFPVRAIHFCLMVEVSIYRIGDWNFWTPKTNGVQSGWSEYLPKRWPRRAAWNA